ncbi:MauE/DoxX family redox-associated membrane protein [uncultured Microbacterium sp.]|uniref:MauE/DoxX family redox-associated membrane protein n=1 Tax=uncultured Microbacterium sp. TaxID=191216 RepID=UPI0026374555|nr:MauE/DoxX family redox-associated membrane protein [uncultured Microbacterium sp.]
MHSVLVVALPLTMAAVLVASGIAKLRNPDDVAGWREMGVPAALQRPWLVRIHPWAEIVLGLTVAALGGWLGVISALIAVTLMVAYLAMVARVVSRKMDASCACFGTRKRVTAVTVWRNAWLSLVAAGAVAVIWSLPLWGGALAATAWEWVLALAVASVTVAFVMWPEADAHLASAAPAEPAFVVTPRTYGDSTGESTGDELEYIRQRTPAVPVTLGGGETATLRELTTSGPVLLLAVSETCGACVEVISRVDEWRERLPEVNVRFLLMTAPGEGALTSATEPQTLHDVNGYVRSSIDDWPTPSAVLLGADGLLAGGPVSGDIAIADFIDDIDAALHS